MWEQVIRRARQETTQTFRYLAVDAATGSDRDVFEITYVPFAGPCGVQEDDLSDFEIAVIQTPRERRAVEFIPFAGDGRTVAA